MENIKKIKLKINNLSKKTKIISCSLVILFLIIITIISSLIYITNKNKSSEIKTTQVEDLSEREIRDEKLGISFTIPAGYKVWKNKTFPLVPVDVITTLTIAPADFDKRFDEGYMKISKTYVNEFDNLTKFIPSSFGGPITTSLCDIKNPIPTSEILRKVKLDSGEELITTDKVGYSFFKYETYETLPDGKINVKKCKSPFNHNNNESWSIDITNINDFTEKSKELDIPSIEKFEKVIKTMKQIPINPLANDLLEPTPSSTPIEATKRPSIKPKVDRSYVLKQYSQNYKTKVKEETPIYNIIVMLKQIDEDIDFTEKTNDSAKLIDKDNTFSITFSAPFIEEPINQPNLPKPQDLIFEERKKISGYIEKDEFSAVYRIKYNGEFYYINLYKDCINGSKNSPCGLPVMYYVESRNPIKNFTVKVNAKDEDGLRKADEVMKKFQFKFGYDK